MGFAAYTDRLGALWPAVLMWVVLSALLYVIRPKDRGLAAAWWLSWLVKSVAAYALVWVGVVQQDLVSDGYGYFKSVEGLKTILLQETSSGVYLLVHHWWTALPHDSPLMASYSAELIYWYDTRSLSTVRWMLPLGYLGGGNFFVFSLLHAALGFAGGWWLFRCSNHLFRQAGWPAGLVWLFIPGTVFWTAGPSKDTLVLFAMGLFAYAVQVAWQLHRERKRGLRFWAAVVGAVLAVFLVATIRVFWLAAWVAVVAVWGASRWLRYAWHRSTAYRVLTLIVFLVVGVWGTTVWYYRPTNLLIEIQYHRERLKADPMGTSRAPIGLQVPLYPAPTTAARVIAAVPSAFASAFYGPLPGQLPGGPFSWNTIAGLEHLLLLLLSVGWLAKHRRQVVQMRWWPPWVAPLLLFAVPYAVLLAFTVVYWGALVRYMALVWPFWALALMGMALPKPTQ